MPWQRLGPPALLTALALLAVTVAVAGCGQQAAAPPPAAGPGAPNAPTLLKQKPRPGEIMVDAEYSPHRNGPFRFHGRYLVRFAQYAPESPRVNFARQTPFVAYLAGLDPRAKKIELFSRAGGGGSREMSLHGRYFVEVSFGDFPYVLRFTPTG